MSGPVSPGRHAADLQQPSPMIRSSRSVRVPNVEFLEQSAESLSIRSRDSPKRRRSDSRRSSLRSRSQISSSPPRPYAAGPSQDRSDIDQQMAQPSLTKPGAEQPGQSAEGNGVGVSPYTLSRHEPQLQQASSSFPQGYQESNSEEIRIRQAYQHRSRAVSGSLGGISEEPNMLAAPQSHGWVSRGPSTATNSTMHHAGSLFRDFDGTHYVSRAPSSAEGYIREEDGPEHVQHPEAFVMAPDDKSAVDQQGNDRDVASGEAEVRHDNDDADEEHVPARFDIMPSRQQNSHWAEPPPAENMVYYPAPVPVKLNRPQRLSQLPPPIVTAQRRSQVLGSLPAQARQSALWLSGIDEEDTKTEQDLIPPESDQNLSKQRQSALNIQKLPPQLRASVFFDQQSVPHNVEVKHGSAVATLDSLLDASAKAPPNASVDDTMKVAVADLKHKRNKSRTPSLMPSLKGDPRKSRLSLMPLRIASADTMSELRKRASSALGLDAYSHDALAQEDECDNDDDYDDGDSDNEATPLADRSAKWSSDSEGEEANRGESEHAEGIEVSHGKEFDGNEYAGAPTTLLAELQFRKQELRSRNRTAVTAFPNGMHSTLLELDAVAQIEKKRRKGQRTTLAWEDPNTVAAVKEEADDEDVPLAMLYPTKTGLVSKAGGADWDRPLGLLAKRNMEESEPLSKRRNRLKGINPNVAKPSEPVDDSARDDESEHEGETLAQRTRRLKSAKALNDAIGDTNGAQTGNGFTNEVMSQFGGLDEDSKQAKEAAAENQAQVSSAEETLGQRRKRLQAEAKAGRPPLRASGSLANLLAENPMGAIRQSSYETPISGLLGQSEQDRLHRRDQLSQQNLFSSSNLLSGPLLNAGQSSGGQRQIGGLLEANAHNLESKRQQIQDTNQRSSTVGINASLVEQQAMVGQSNKVGTQAPLADPRASFRQTKSYLSGIHSDGFRAGVAPRAISGFPHLQSQSSLQTRGFASSGFGISPQRTTSMQNTPFGITSVASPDAAMTQSMQGLSLQPLQVEETGDQAMSSKQRENIDRWRQSVMY